MKSILTLSIALLAAVMFTAGCETDLNSSSDAPDIRPMAAGGSQSDADPAIVYLTEVTSKGKTYNAIAVMDSNGANPTTVYTATSTAHAIGAGPSWKPGGGTIAFGVFSTDGSLPWTIYLRDVSVSHGKPVGSNTRSLYSPSSGYVRGLAWSSLASTAKVALATHLPTGSARVEVISTSGGTPTVLYQSDTSNGIHYYNNPTWSPDDLKIAFVDRTQSSGIDTVRVISSSTGELLASIPLGQTFTYASQIEWSRTGLNQLVMSIDYTNNSASDGKLYYVTPTTGSAPSTNNVSGSNPTWSPNNSSVVSLVTGSTNTLQKTVTGTTTTTTIATGKIWKPNWKR